MPWKRWSSGEEPGFGRGGGGVGVKIWPDRWLERVRKLKVKMELEEDKKGKTACGLGGEGVGNSVVG